MEMLCKQFENKLCTLLSFLTKLPTELEMIAEEIDNENLKNALTAVAIESNQYARELSSHLRALEIHPPLPALLNFEEQFIEGDFAEGDITKGKEVLNICEKSEAFFTRLYTDVLSEYLPNASLKDMMQYQLLGIKSAFMRIRFLNTMRFSQ